MMVTFMRWSSSLASTITSGALDTEHLCVRRVIVNQPPQSTNCASLITAKSGSVSASSTVAVWIARLLKNHHL